MNLKQLLEGISYEVQQGTADVEISDFQYDSRKVEKDGLFVCITGFQTDGHKYIEKAAQSGAVCAVVTATGAVFQVKAVVVATGTYLGGRTIVGDVFRDSGPDGLQAALELTGCLEKLGVTIQTDTVIGRTIPVEELLKDGSRPAHPLVSTPAAWISPRWNCKKGIRNRCPSPSPPTMRRKIRRCAISPTPMR